MFATTEALAFQRSAELARSFKNTVFEDGGVQNISRVKIYRTTKFTLLFHSDCSVYSQFTANLAKGERRKKRSSLVFSSEPHPIFEFYHQIAAKNDFFCVSLRKI